MLLVVLDQLRHERPCEHCIVHSRFGARFGNTIINEPVVRDLIPLLKEAGASGIVEYPLNKIID